MASFKIYFQELCSMAICSILLIGYFKPLLLLRHGPQIAKR